MQVPIDERKLDAGTIVWRDPETGERFETPVTGGHAKLQWKPDWAMRWVALGVDYEMAGKDLIDSVKLSGEIAKALGGLPPEGSTTSSSSTRRARRSRSPKGNGLTIDEWLAYGTPESLALFMFTKPREAKRLYFDVIPRQVDDYLTFLERFPGQDAKRACRTRSGTSMPASRRRRSSSPRRRQPAGRDDLLLDAPQPRGGRRIRGSGRAVGLHPPLRAGRVAGEPSAPRPAGRRAVRYFEDFVKPQKTYRLPTRWRRPALRASEVARHLRGGRRPADRRGDPGRGLQCRPRRAALPGPQGQGGDPESAPASHRVVQHDLSDPARRAARPALRLLRGALWREGDAALIAKALDGDLLREHEAFLKEREAGARAARAPVLLPRPHDPGGPGDLLPAGMPGLLVLG